MIRPDVDHALLLALFALGGTATQHTETYTLSAGAFTILDVYHASSASFLFFPFFLFALSCTGASVQLLV